MGEHKPTKGTEKQGASRREFVKTAVAGAVGVTVGYQVSRGEADVPKAPSGVPFNERTFAAMPTRNLGKTGHRVGIFSLGGQATLEKPNMEDQAVAIVNRAIELGVNYLDWRWSKSWGSSG
jgi:hypothetical protein